MVEISLLELCWGGDGAQGSSGDLCVGRPWQEAIVAFPFASEAADTLVEGINSSKKKRVDMAHLCEGSAGPLASSLPGSCSALSQRRFVLLVCEWFGCLPTCFSPSACFKCFPSPGLSLFFSASSNGACVTLPNLPGFLFSALSPLRLLDLGRFSQSNSRFAASHHLILLPLLLQNKAVVSSAAVQVDYSVSLVHV